MFLLVFSRCRRGGDTDKSVVDRKSVSFRRGGGGIVGRIGWKSGRCRNGSDGGAAEGGGGGGAGEARTGPRVNGSPRPFVVCVVREHIDGEIEARYEARSPSRAPFQPMMRLLHSYLAPRYRRLPSHGLEEPLLSLCDLFAVHVRVHTSFSRSFPFDRLFLPSPPPSPQQQRNKEESKDG